MRKRQFGKIRDKKQDSRVKESTILSNYLNATSVICSIMAFIVGVLSAAPIKRILAWLLSDV